MRILGTKGVRLIRKVSLEVQKLRDKYDVTGRFYTESGRHFRSFLNIREKRVGFPKFLIWMKRLLRFEKPDLMVVMMNPGGSMPKAGGNDGRVEVPTHPDDTQDQIMRVMNAKGFKFARVLNLFDIRDADSKNLPALLPILAKIEPNHSIFSEGRASELGGLFVHSVPVILGWGVYTWLREPAQTAQTYMKNPLRVGWKKGVSDWEYYHPLPPNKRRQEDWLKEVLRQFGL